VKEWLLLGVGLAGLTYEALTHGDYRVAMSGFFFALALAGAGLGWYKNGRGKTHD